MSLRIADVAAKSGVSPATIRYYERIGILPPAPRSPNGYRTYGDDTLARLAFIGRAKSLGCTLDEIGELLVAWEGKECGPVQDRLKDLVAAKLRSAQDEIVELVQLVADLRRAAGAFAQHRPSGPCDDACGCTGGPAGAAPGPIGIELSARHPADRTSIACTLPADQFADRLTDWSALLDADDERVAKQSAIPGGVRRELPAATDVGELARLAAAEHECCSFLSFAITIDERGIGFEVTAPTEASELVAAGFGGVA